MKIMDKVYLPNTEELDGDFVIGKGRFKIQYDNDTLMDTLP